MIIEQTGTGASYEEAVEDAKLRLAAPVEAELHFDTVQEAKKGFLGIGNKPAMVRVWYEAPDPKPAVRPAKPAAKPAPEKPEKKSAPQPQQQKKNNQPKKEAAPKAEAVKKEAAPKAEEKFTDLPVNEDDPAVKFLRLVVAGMKIDRCDITLQKNETANEYIYTLDCGEDNRVLIGRRGETLDAVQYLLRLTENKGVNEDKHRKLTVNIGDYREKRSQNLTSEAQRAARQVLKYGKNVGLEPMSAYERRIIHTTIQGIEGVTSHSVGSDSNRRVIVSLEEGVTPTNPSHGGGRRDGGRRDGGRGGRGGRGPKREAYQPSTTREPRKDTEGAALYGKIEIPAKPEDEE